MHTRRMVATHLQVSFLEPDAFPEAIEFFDAEFIFSRGRTISFAQRFRDVFASDECFVVAGRNGRRLISALLGRPFTWIEGNRRWRAVMIGLVCTASPYRGRGYAAAVLNAAEQHCRALEHDFAVLWAANHEVYERLGWVASEKGVLGIRRTPLGGGPAGSSELHETSIFEIQTLHETRDGARVDRQLDNYCRLLPPAERLRFFLEGRSFALCAEFGRAGYIYDLLATDADMPQLWDKLSKSFDDLYVNVECNSAAHRWLQTHTTLEWKTHALAMWKPLRAESIPVQRWYIPFFDRI